MPELHTITADKLIFSGKVEDDRTNTLLELDDYDWMHYTLKTRFRTERDGILEVLFDYFGCNACKMQVKQIIEGQPVIDYEYTFDSDIFEKHIINFLAHHIAHWNDEYAFNGEDQVLRFFNNVLENYEKVEITQEEENR